MNIEYGQMVCTRKGLLLQAGAQTGVPLRLTKVAVGDGHVEQEHLHELIAQSELISPKATFPVSGLRTNQDGTASLFCTITNQDLVEGFYLREIGILAEVNGEEVLYAILNDGDYADFLPGNANRVVNTRLELITVVGNAANLELTIENDMDFATKEELMHLAGNGRTIETVKKNADDILGLLLRLDKVESVLFNNVPENSFEVEFGEIEESEIFEGIWNIALKRLEV